MADYLDEDGVLTLWEKNKELASTKQDTLVSGENIRTVNGMSLLGSGNIALEGGSGGGSSEIKAAMSIDGTLEVTGSVKANDVQATMFMIPNGTSEQVLLADGSTKNISEIGGSGEDDRYSQLLGLLSESNYNIPTEDVLAGGYVWDDGSDNSDGFAGLMFNPDGDGKMLSYSNEFGWQEYSSAWAFPNIPVATTTSGGVISPEDKAKLDAIDPTSKPPFTHGTGAGSAVIDSDTFCEATGVSSFAMGIHAKAIGEASVAMGRYAKAEGRASFALGGAMNSAYFTGEANATEYIVTNLWGHYKEDVTLLIGHDILEYRTDNNQTYLAKITNAEPTDTYGTARITVDKSLSEEAISNMRCYIHYCRAVGKNSVILGCGSALGIFSAAIGCSTASGNYSMAIGFGTIATGSQSFSSGTYTKAEGTDSHAEGYRTISKGRTSHAEGYLTRAIGLGAHAEGVGSYKVYLTGDGTSTTYHILKGTTFQCVEDLNKLIGGEIIETNDYSTVATIQSYSIADDGYSISVVLDKSLGALDNAYYSIILNIASGDYSHTQNGGNKASGTGASAMGSHNIASGEWSLASGTNTFAKGAHTSTHGEHTYALNKNEAAFGVSNISHNGEDLDAQTLFSIGCGDDLSGMDMHSRIEQRIPFPKMEDGRNAIEVMRNGDIWFGGYNTGVKIWDVRLRKSPYLIDPNGTKQQVVLGDGSLKSISELSPINYTKEDVNGDSYERLIWNITEDPEDGLINTYEQRIEKDGNSIVTHLDVFNNNGNKEYVSFFEIGNQNDWVNISPSGVEGSSSTHGGFILDYSGCYASKFVTHDGTSTQILMADGSVKELSEISGDSGYSKFTDAVYNAAGNLFIPSEEFFNGAFWSDDSYYKECAINFGVGNVANGLYWNEEEKEWVYGNNIGSIIIPYASDSRAGAMSAADKQKLDALGIGAVGVPETLNCNTTYIEELADGDTLSITGFVAPTTLFGNYTVHLKTSTNNSISLPSTLLWANGEQPVFEDNTCYELSITATLFDAEYVYKAVLVAFK